MASSFVKAREIICPGFIDEKGLERMLQELEKLAAKRSNNSIVIRMTNNRGGIVTDKLFHFIKRMGEVKCGVAVISSGTVDSCGALILMSGSQGLRFITKDSTALLHGPQLIGIPVAVLDSEGRIPSDVFEEALRAKVRFREIVETSTNIDHEGLDLIFEQGQEVTLVGQRIIDVGLADVFSA